MKTVAKRLLSLALGLCLAVAGVFTIAPTVTASAADGIWTLVKDVNDLAVEDQVIIAAKNYSVAMSTNQKSNNRGEATIIKSGDTATINSSVQIFTLKEGTVAGTFAFYTGSQYIYAASSSSNHLKSQATNNDNGSWKIEIASTGVATIKAQGTNTRNWIRYNDAANNGHLFSCYSQNQTDVCLYKLVTGTAAPIVSVSGAEYGQVGDDINLTANLTNITGDVTWTSSNNAIAEVDEDGVVTAYAMGKATITADINGIKGTQDITVYPAENSELTIAQAIELCKFTGESNTPYKYSTTGVITDITYSSEHGNSDVIITDGTDSIKAYRMEGGSELKVGDKIKVTGNLLNYKKDGVYTPEFAQYCTYVTIVDDDATATVKEALANTQAYMSLAYKYTATTKTETLLAEVTDKLTRTTTGIASASNYGTWSNKKATSNAVYAGQSAGSNDTIQLRSDNNNSGIVTTASGGKATKITVEWYSETKSERILQVYGSNTAYTQATDLYNTTTQGTLLGELAKGTTELVLKGDYEYIGLRSKSGAMYLTSVSIEWNGGSEGGEQEVTVLENSDFRLMCAIDASLLELESTEVGILVTANGKSVNYTTTAKSWTVEDGKAYVVISLGDIGNNGTKLTTEFTVQAYAIVDDITYMSENAKTYSVATMVAEYQKGGEAVGHLYNYLVEKGLIEVEEVA